MSRLFLENPLHIGVELDTTGYPAAVMWELEERVVEVVNRWRVDDDWWRVPISRMYYKLQTPTALLDVYQDLITGEWYLERVHD